MTVYHAPTRDMRFAIEELAELESLAKMPGFGSAEPDVVESVLEEAGRFAAEVLAPLNPEGDRNGARLDGDNVQETPGFAEAYRQFAESGWNALPFSDAIGGSGMPAAVSFAVSEIWQAANMSFSLCPMLTQAGIEALEFHGTEEQQQRYLPRLVSGEWTGTMDLTEPQAGSDLAALRCKAVPEGDHYRISGQKIYITWGDHQMTENIIHMVLARIEGAPDGVKGISLFMVPKFLVNSDGSLGERNDMRPVSLEHKMGIHASPTCVMSFGDGAGAIGYLVGEANHGLACMFTMMNNARLVVGVQGAGIAERAYQRAVRYANDRVQGTAPGSGERVTIIHHPDVRRMLMTMKSQCEAMRALCVVAGATMDRARNHTDEGVRQSQQARLDLLVPAVKGWCTEQAQEVVSLALQVHGGMGYVEETGAAQHFRDARIATIYEGTTGIQAQDLARRKIQRDGGRAMRELITDIRGTVLELADVGEFTAIERNLRIAVDSLETVTEFLLSSDDPNEAGTLSNNLLMLTGTTVAGWLMAQSALIARKRLSEGGSGSEFLRTKIITARYFGEHVLVRSRSYAEAAMAGSETTMALSPEQF